MIDILKRCDYLYANLQDCEDKQNNPLKDGDCNICLKNNFSNIENDKYDCIKKLALYTLYFGRLYMEEIYYFITESKILELFLEKQNINILSLGAGFCPDNIALEKYISDNGLYLNYNYFGFDSEKNWRIVRNDKDTSIAKWRVIEDDIYEILPKVRSVLYDMNLYHYDIIFINKLFSSLEEVKKDIFLMKFTSAINNLPANSLIIFNDRSEFALIDKFRKAIPKSLFDLIGKYYIESSCCPRETDFVEISFDYTALNNNEKVNKNKTTFLVFKKVK